MDKRDLDKTPESLQGALDQIHRMGEELMGLGDAVLIECRESIGLATDRLLGYREFAQNIRSWLAPQTNNPPKTIELEAAVEARQIEVREALTPDEPRREQ